MTKQNKTTGIVRKNTPPSNNIIQVFKSELTKGREFRILGSPSDPYFVAKDIALFLDYKDTKKAIVSHVDNEDKLDWKEFKNFKGGKLPPLKLHPKTKLINESGLYSLILRSKNKKAKMFKRWVTSEVLPSIRKNGEYKLNQKIALLEQQNFALQKKHNALVRRHFYYKFKQKGPSLYIITSGLEYKDGVTRIKFGICGCPKRKISTCPHCKKNLEDGKDNDSIDNRLSTHRTLWPRLLVKFVVYTPDARLLEKCLKRVYRNQINPSGHEIVEGVTVSEIVDRTKRYLEMFNVFNDEPDYTVEKNVNKYNQRTLEIMKDSSSEKKNLMLDHLSQISLDGSEELEEELGEELEEESGQESGEGSEGESDMFIVESESEEEESEDEEARLEEARLEEERRRKEAAKEEQVKREFDAKQKEYFEGLLRDLKTYTDKRLKELLREWRLPLSGLKAKKKERVEGYLRKKLNIEGKKIVCQSCREEKNVGSDNFRLTERKLYSRVCLVCEVKKTKTTYLYRTDVYTTIKPSEKTKKCTKCKKMLSFNDFHNNRSRKDGKEYQCKNCSSKRKAKSGKVRLEKKRPSVPDGCKWCPKCEVTKSRDAFRNASRRKDGLQGMCRNCDNETRRRNRLKKKLQR